ncbi:MAG: hypothetical protein WAQ27_00500 [Candidatus Microsaccharimonas sp.]
MIVRIVRGIRADDFMPVLQIVLDDGQVAIVESDKHEAAFQEGLRLLRLMENGLRSINPEDTIEEATTL